MPKVTTLVVGAGHCGLAMSRCLAERSIDHVVLERGELADSWRTRRSDAFRLLTPNWMIRLPGKAYTGDDPDGYLTAPELVRFIDDYATVNGAPVRTNTPVTSVSPCDTGFLVRTNHDVWEARTVVVASGACAVARTPSFAEAIPPEIVTLTALDYRTPDQLPEGGVLVVGASSSGIQIADELHRSGRPVTLAVGEHVRMPRCYRGLDVLWWMDAAGLLDERYDEVPDLLRARNLPSMQLVGSPQRVTLDLNALSRGGVRLVGRVAGVRDGRAQFSGSLRNVCALADLKLGRLLDSFDDWAASAGFDDCGPAERFAETEVPASPALTLDLGEINSVVWATGFRPDLTWLDVPVLDRKGQVRHDGGVTAWPGLYIMGMPFLRRRKSTLIDGAAADATELADHLVGHLDSSTRDARWEPAASAGRLDRQPEVGLP
ncbi:flavin-containing monooxygenase [Actinocrispum wychmicini]|uniref:Putative flavoprotein involved in K+ transport n=1 Tax=Actinocrispum wychmicini TaxID=1213861 RepID=A0A4R2J6I8_9PSEU|nr:NAD(P)/FAD-dependent oxidoreductase [Actinocrispum wychmicini]TCO54064.1 putative flavoprotein involved in K+ transport [Actinocrispum wychmicini]